MDTQGIRRLPPVTAFVRRARMPRGVAYAAGICAIVALLASPSRPAAASHVALCYFGLQCVEETRDDSPDPARSQDEPYVVNYAVVLNGPTYFRWARITGPVTGVDSGETNLGGSCFWGADDPQNVIWLVAVMEHDRSDLRLAFPKPSSSVVFDRLDATADALKAAAANRATWVAELSTEMDRALRDVAVATAGSLDPDDLIARPEEVPLNRLDFDFAGGGAHLIKRVHHVGAVGHYVTLHRLRPR